MRILAVTSAARNSLFQSYIEQSEVTFADSLEQLEGLAHSTAAAFHAVLYDFPHQGHVCVSKFKNIVDLFSRSKIYVCLPGDINTDELLTKFLKLGAHGFFLNITAPENVRLMLQRNSASIFLQTEQYGCIELTEKLLTCAFGSVRLTNQESSLFKMLIRAEGEAVTYKKLLECIGYRTDTLDTHAIETSLSRIRKKLKELNVHDLIVSVKDQKSYRLVTK